MNDNGGNLPDIRAEVEGDIIARLTAKGHLTRPTGVLWEERRPWCLTCQHEHIVEIPRVTWLCHACGFGGWSRGIAISHEANIGHRHITYPVTHRFAEARPRTQYLEELAFELYVKHGAGTTPWCDLPEEHRMAWRDRAADRFGRNR